MSDRFEKLYELPNNLYSAGSPVIVAAGALLKDNETGSIIVQLKFQSVSQVVIKAVSINISAYDVTGKAVDGTDYQFLDLSVSDGAFFGSNKAIILPAKTTRSFALGGLTVVFADGTAKTVSLPQTALPVDDSLEQSLGNAELVKQYRIATNQEASQVPCEAMTLWRCPCGTWNAHPTCTKCALKKETAFSCFNRHVLTDHMERRLLTEQEMQKKEAAQKEFEDQQRKIKNKKLTLIGSVLTAIIGIVLAFFYWIQPQIIVPSKAYNKAIALFDQGKYEEAALAFQELGDYKDAIQRLEESQGCILDRKYENGLLLMQQQDYESAITQFKELEGYKDSETKIEEAVIGILDLKYSDAEQLLASGEYEQAIQVFTEIINYSDTITNYKDSTAKIEEAKNGILANEYFAAEQLYNKGDIVGAALAFAALDNFSDAKARSFIIWGEITQRDTIAAYENTSLGINKDGSVVFAGGNWDGQGDIEDWNDIVAVSMGDRHSVGLRSDGTVVAVGYGGNNRLSVAGWHDIVAISAGFSHTVGLRSDGTVVAIGENWDDQCEVDDWSDIIAISAGEVHTVGLKSDGTVVATDISSFADGNWGQCEVSDWKDIVAICAGDNHTVGLKADGTVVAVGLDWTFAGVEEWTDIIAISASGQHTFGLKSDGTVLRVGRTVHDYGSYDVSGWRDIVAIHTSQTHTLGLKSDGTVVAIGDHEYGQCDVSNWKNILLPNKYLSKE